MDVPYFEAAGSHRQIGEMIGRAFSGQIRQFLHPFLAVNLKCG